MSTAPSIDHALQGNINWQIVECTQTRPAYLQYMGEIRKPMTDDRPYRLIRLVNGLQALLIHDAMAQNAGACLNVAVGHLMDPEDIPGLAHFCEHMLFLGTEQYPNEAEYASFIAANGGDVYASTGTSYTSYRFFVLPSALRGALMRFSTMFISPLFTPSSTLRELQAVDSEHTQSAHNDFYRIRQVVKSLCDTGHPWSKFGYGNMKSLTSTGLHAYERSSAAQRMNEYLGTSENDDGGIAEREIRRRLIEWWAQHYCAGRMKLVILGTETLDELTDVTINLFGPIKHRGVDPHTSFNPHPYDEKEEGTIIFVKSLSNMTYLDMSFPIPNQGPEFRTKPAQFLGYIVGFSGPGTLESYLKGKGWISQLGISSQELAAGLDIFGVQVALTPSGLAQYRDVATAIHGYFRSLQTSTLPKYLYQELKQLTDIWFRFQHKDPDTARYVSGLAKQLQAPYSPEDCVLSAPCYDGDYDDQAVREILDMLTPQHVRLVVVAKDLEAIAPEGEWLKEKWYGTEYKVSQYDEELMQLALNSADNLPEFSFPPPNEFVPVNVEILKQDVDQPLQEPNLLCETPLFSLWHKKDDQFWVPHGSISLFIVCPVANATPRHAVMTEMYIDSVRQILIGRIQAAVSVGFDYELIKMADCLSLRVGGYSTKVPTLLGRILEGMKSFRPHPDSFEGTIAVQQEGLENWGLSTPTVMAKYFCEYFIANEMWSHEERLSQLPLITFEEFCTHCTELLPCVHIRALVHGNFIAEEALDLMELVITILQPDPLPTPVRLSTPKMVLPEGTNFIRQQSLPNSAELDSCVAYYCQVADFEDLKTSAVLCIIARILEEPFFRQLRTQEQLGYLVYCHYQLRRPSVGLCFSVQSEQDAVYCETRIDAFLEAVEDLLRNFPEKDFETCKGISIQEEEVKWGNLEVERQQFWAIIKSGSYNFRFHEQYANALREVVLDDVVNLFMTRIHPASLTRSKLSVHMMSQIRPAGNAGILVQGTGTPVTHITNLEEFRSKLLPPTNVPLLQLTNQSTS